MERYLDRQLHPRGDALPATVQSKIAGFFISLDQLVLGLEEQRKAADAIANGDDKKAAQQANQQALTKVSNEAAARSLVRDLYSPNQLQEQMTWFWTNHFNVFLQEQPARDDRGFRGPRDLPACPRPFSRPARSNHAASGDAAIPRQ